MDRTLGTGAGVWALGVKFVSLAESIDTGTPAGRFIGAAAASWAASSAAVGLGPMFTVWLTVASLVRESDAEGHTGQPIRPVMLWFSNAPASPTEFVGLQLGQNEEAYILRVRCPDGSQATEVFDDEPTLVERGIKLQGDLITCGWQSWPEPARLSANKS